MKDGKELTVLIPSTKANNLASYRVDNRPRGAINAARFLRFTSCSSAPCYGELRPAFDRVDL